jgi:glyceraldehyde 3-phosphate dehydrogenase
METPKIAINIIPTSTVTARAIGRVIPDLDGKMDGMTMRVPVPDGSVVDFTLELEKAVAPDVVNNAIREAAEGSLVLQQQSSQEIGDD